MNITGWKATLVGSAALIVGATDAAAQQAPVPAPVPEAAAAEEDVTQSGDVVVTARRRDERLMGVPVVVSAITSEALERYDSDSLQAIGEMTPTVIVGAYKINGGGSIAIRGISSPANQVGFEQAVSVAIDGIQVSNGHIAQQGFFDLQQVETLKGPQALFFGRNNTAGVISLITARPTNEFEASLSQSYEFVAAESTTEGILSGPLTDALSARVAVRYRYMDGWLENTARTMTNPFYNSGTGAPASVGTLPGTTDDRPGEEEIMGRFTLAFDPTPNFGATLRAFIAHTEDGGAGASNQNIGPCSDGHPRVSGVADPYGECEADDRITMGNVPVDVARTIPGAPSDGSFFGDLDTQLISLNMDWDIGALRLTSLTGYSEMRYNYFTGGDQTTFSQLGVREDQTQEDVSQEFRLTSDFDGPINFVLGAFYQDSTSTVDAITKLNDGNYNAVADRYASFESWTAIDGTTESVFGQLIWDATDTIEVAGGLRWTGEEKDFIKYNTYGIGGFNTLATVYAGSDTPGTLIGHFEDENISPEVTVTWRPDSDHTLFAAYRTGFKSGGFGMTNPLQTSTTIDGVDFNSETASGYEIGARGNFLDGRLSLSGAIFNYTYEDLQVNTYDPAIIAFTINNAGSLEQTGFELEGTYRVTDEFSLHGAIAYVNNEFHDFTGQCYSYAFPTGSVRATATPPPNCEFANNTTLALQQVYDGRAPARSPEWAGNAGFLWEGPFGNYVVSYTGDAYYRDSYYAADTLAPASFQDSFWLFNASASISPPDENWRVALMGRNLTEEYYVLYAVDRTGGAGVPGAAGEQRGVVSRGREIMLRASVNF